MLPMPDNYKPPPRLPGGFDPSPLAQTDANLPPMKKSSGQPAHKPTEAGRNLVTSLAASGTPQDEIAGIIEIAAKTLREHYRAELDFGMARANAQVADNLFKKATGEGKEQRIAAIFWLKTRAGWKETTVTENTTANFVVSAEPLTEDDWRAKHGAN